MTFGIEAIENARQAHAKGVSELLLSKVGDTAIHPVGGLALVHNILLIAAEEQEPLNVSHAILDARLKVPGALDYKPHQSFGSV